MAAAANVNEKNRRRGCASAPPLASAKKRRPMAADRETDFVSKMELSWQMPFYPGNRQNVKHFGIF
jgi:hypothetical protein